MKFLGVLAGLTLLSSADALGSKGNMVDISGVTKEVQMSSAAFSEYTSAQECTGTPRNADKTCWYDSVDKVFYRYGCTEGETRIYSDSCTSPSCDPSSCTNEWFWEGEMEDTCYDDGVQTYTYTCSPGSSSTSTITTLPVTTLPVTTLPVTTLPARTYTTPTYTTPTYTTLPATTTTVGSASYMGSVRATPALGAGTGIMRTSSGATVVRG